MANKKKVLVVDHRNRGRALLTMIGAAMLGGGRPSYAPAKAHRCGACAPCVRSIEAAKAKRERKAAAKAARHA